MRWIIRSPPFLHDVAFRPRWRAGPRVVRVKKEETTYLTKERVARVCRIPTKDWPPLLLCPGLEYDLVLVDKAPVADTCSVAGRTGAKLSACMRVWFVDCFLFYTVSAISM